MWCNLHQICKNSKKITEYFHKKKALKDFSEMNKCMTLGSTDRLHRSEPVVKFLKYSQIQLHP